MKFKRSSAPWLKDSEFCKDKNVLDNLSRNFYHSELTVRQNCLIARNSYKK